MDKSKISNYFASLLYIILAIPSHLYHCLPFRGNRLTLAWNIFNDVRTQCDIAPNYVIFFWGDFGKEFKFSQIGLQKVDGQSKFKGTFESCAQRQVHCSTVFSNWNSAAKLKSVWGLHLFYDVECDQVLFGKCRAEQLRGSIFEFTSFGAKSWEQSLFFDFW